MDHGDATAADQKLHDAVRLYEEIGDRLAAHWIHTNLGQNARFRGDLAVAEHHYRIALTTMRAFKNRALAAVILSFLGHLLLARSDLAEAAAVYREAVGELSLAGNRRHIADCLDGLAVIIAMRGEPGTGARLMGAAVAIREAIRVPLAPAERPIAEQRVGFVRGLLSADAFQAAWHAGGLLTWEEAAEEALASLAAIPHLPEAHSADALAVAR